MYACICVYVIILIFTHHHHLISSPTPLLYYIITGYPIPAAFMSSKPKAGINHKVYGVTSEGVVVHLRTALEEFSGIDPYKEKFTIKITGIL